MTRIVKLAEAILKTYLDGNICRFCGARKRITTVDHDLDCVVIVANEVYGTNLYYLPPYDV